LIMNGLRLSEKSICQ